jgi:hypothetical protein
VISTIASLRGRSHVRLLLDYDGTLVPLARSPELAAPDEDVLTLLHNLVTAPGLEVDIVSGRPRHTIAECSVPRRCPCRCGPSTDSGIDREAGRHGSRRHASGRTG